MRVLSSVAVMLMASVATVSAGTMAPAASCLATCNQEVVSCMTECPVACPSDAVCMSNCYQTCSTVESECAAECAAPVESNVSEALYQSEFTMFVKKHAKKYTTDEFFTRYQIFKANYNKIRDHNMSKSSYSMAVNEFADMTATEFSAKMTGLNAIDNEFMRNANTEGPHSRLTNVASSLDWRAKGAVTNVKNQQSCGSCWAFSATGSLEGATQIKTGKLHILSEQQLVDCSTPQGNHGCNGGLMDNAFQYIMSNKGITSEANYPYTARDGTCKTGMPAVATVSRFVNVKRGSEEDLMAAVNIVPVSIAIAASPQPFQFYSGGILDNPACGSRLDHGVTLVGYGTEGGKDYWQVKNSWGTTWGEKGYIRMVRGKNQCGLANMSSYAVA